MITVYVPNDTSACALGADAVAAALQAGAAQYQRDIRIVRNGSRGLYWLEPLIEVDTEAGRIAYGPVSVDIVAELFAHGFPHCPQHRLCLGQTEQIDYLRHQQRLTFQRAGVIDPLSLDDYRAHGGFAGLQQALNRTPQQLVDAIQQSGLRGRGGAAFPAGIKWQAVLAAAGAQKYIVCNADEGDSGTFADRLLLEADPFQLIEGMLIAGLAVGATQGFVYLRSEYPRAYRVLCEAIALATAANYLGDDVLGSGKAFSLEVRLGAGAYICGEETALLESLEGKRGMVRAKPPLPAQKGLFGAPTLLHNVLTFAAATTILAHGAEFYRTFGSGKSRGTVAVQLAGNIRRGGLVELAFDKTLRQLIEEFGGGTRSGRPVRAVQIGGPLGAYLPDALWDTPLDYEAMTRIGAMLGHGGVVVFDDSVDMREQARFAMEFCAAESCGKCTPCRIGSVRGAEVIEKIQRNEQRADNLLLLRDLCDTMEHGSLCAMGGMTPVPVRSALDYFPEDFQR